MASPNLDPIWPTCLFISLHQAPHVRPFLLDKAGKLIRGEQCGIGECWGGLGSLNTFPKRRVKKKPIYIAGVGNPKGLKVAF